MKQCPLCLVASLLNISPGYAEGEKHGVRFAHSSSPPPSKWTHEVGPMGACCAGKWLSERGRGPVFPTNGGAHGAGSWGLPGPRSQTEYAEWQRGLFEGSRDGEPVGFAEHEPGVGGALGVGEPQVHGGGVGSEQAGAVDTVVVPVVGDEAVAGVPNTNWASACALGVGVAEVHETGRFAVQTNRVDAVAVEVPDERFVTGVPEHIRRVGDAEALVAVAEFVDDVERLVCRPVHRHGVDIRPR